MTEPIPICRGFTDQQWMDLRKRLQDGDESAWNCAIEVFSRRLRERFFACIDELIRADSRKDVPNSAGAPADCSSLPDDGGVPVLVPGFAIIALCCLLTETLQQFRAAAPHAAAAPGPCAYPATPCIKPSTTDQFREFLRRPAFRGEFGDDKVARDFVRGVRNGIFHEAKTRGWLIWRDEPPGRIIAEEGDRYALNRTEFYRALEAEFDTYLAELRNPSNSELRSRFLKKMDDVVGEC